VDLCLGVPSCRTEALTNLVKDWVTYAHLISLDI
jgi:hypothetical protein